MRKTNIHAHTHTHTHTHTHRQTHTHTHNHTHTHTQHKHTHNIHCYIQARKVAVAHLREASGIFEASPGLVDLGSYRPLDTRQSCLDALGQMSLANAQELVVLSAIDKGTSATLLAKLCLGQYSERT
jgi:hypothetical protein